MLLKLALEYLRYLILVNCFLSQRILDLIIINICNPNLVIRRKVKKYYCKI